MIAEAFTLNVDYKGEKNLLEGELRHTGYIHKIFLRVKGIEIIFEPDEERNYRAVITSPEDAERFDKGLLQAIASELERVLE